MKQIQSVDQSNEKRPNTFFLTSCQVYLLNFLGLPRKEERDCLSGPDGAGGDKVGGAQAGEGCVCCWWVGVLTRTQTTICSCSWPSLKKRHWQDGHFSKAPLSSIIIRLQPSGEQPERGVMSSFTTLKYKQVIVHWSPCRKCLRAFLKLLSFSYSLYLSLWSPSSEENSSWNWKVFAPEDGHKISWIQVENPLVSHVLQRIFPFKVCYLVFLSCSVLKI